jgi:hypothetical protein
MTAGRSTDRRGRKMWTTGLRAWAGATPVSGGPDRPDLPSRLSREEVAPAQAMHIAVNAITHAIASAIAQHDPHENAQPDLPEQERSDVLHS